MTVAGTAAARGWVTVALVETTAAVPMEARAKTRAQATAMAAVSGNSCSNPC